MTKSLSSWMCAKNYWDMFKWVSHRSFFVIMACGETQGYEYQHLSGYRVIYIYKIHSSFSKKSHSLLTLILLFTSTQKLIFVEGRECRYTHWRDVHAGQTLLNLPLEYTRRDNRSKLSQIYICVFENAHSYFRLPHAQMWTHIHKHNIDL